MKAFNIRPRTVRHRDSKRQSSTAEAHIETQETHSEDSLEKTHVEDSPTEKSRDLSVRVRVRGDV